MTNLFNFPIGPLIDVQRYLWSIPSNLIEKVEISSKPTLLILQTYKLIVKTLKENSKKKKEKPRNWIGSTLTDRQIKSYWLVRPHKINV